MVRLLSSLASLLLAAGAWAHDREHADNTDGSIEAAGTGCKLRDYDPQTGRAATWSGKCVAGSAQGHGTAQWFQHGRPVDRYEGNLRAGDPHGRGLYTYADGSWYEGDWQDGQISGQGILFFRNGDWYKGEWLRSLPNGEGTVQFTDGYTYVGVWRDGCLHQGGYTASVGVSQVECEARAPR